MSRGPAPGVVNVQTRACPTCGDRFFTGVGLANHMASGTHDTLSRRWVGGVSPEGREKRRETGRRVAALNNARRRRCEACELTSTPAGVAGHQIATGHEGWAEE